VKFWWEFFEPLLDFLGLENVGNTWHASNEMKNAERWITKTYVILVGAVNAFDMVLDLIMGTKATFVKTEESCEYNYEVGLTLFIMTFMAGLLSIYYGKIQKEPSWKEKMDAKGKARLFVTFEVTIFLMEDTVSILFLATSPCSLNLLETMSLVSTLVLTTAYGLFVLLIIYEMGGNFGLYNVCCKILYHDYSDAHPFAIFITAIIWLIETAIVVFFGYIAMEWILNSNEALDIQDPLYPAAYWLYWVGAAIFFNYFAFLMSLVRNKRPQTGNTVTVINI